MTDDIVERLRKYYSSTAPNIPMDAADEIKRLREAILQRERVLKTAIEERDKAYAASRFLYSKIPWPCREQACERWPWLEEPE